MPYLSVAKRGFSSKFDPLPIVAAILYKLKSGCQWECLPVRHFFDGQMPSYKTVCYHYRKWCKIGDWEKMFPGLVMKYRNLVDLSLSYIDGSHTPAIRGGDGVEYQGQKNAKPPFPFISPTDWEFRWQCPNLGKATMQTCIR